MRELCWLPIHYQLRFKILVLLYKWGFLAMVLIAKQEWDSFKALCQQEWDSFTKGLVEPVPLTFHGHQLIHSNFNGASRYPERVFIAWVTAAFAFKLSQGFTLRTFPHEPLTGQGLPAFTLQLHQTLLWVLGVEAAKIYDTVLDMGF